MADKLSARFAAVHWVECGDGEHYCEAPVITRGVPHNLVPGVHRCMDEYLNALETLREVTGRGDAPTVDSLTCLPFGPFSQALPPVIEATADMSMRLCVRDTGLLSVQSGHAYLPDSTPEEQAIVREPLFRRPCQASVSDNPFATSYEHMDSFFNLANGVVLVARCMKLEHPSPLLYEGKSTTQVAAERVDAWINGGGEGQATCPSFCGDTLLKLSLMYPQTHGIAQGVVLPAWAAAVPALQRRLRSGHGGCHFGQLGLPDELVHQGRSWWAAFVRATNPVWTGGPLGDLLCALDEHDGSHDVSLERCARVRGCLERSVQAAWLVASVDGMQPPEDPEHPASEAPLPSKVRRPMIDPVFVGDKKRGVKQRGCLVGVKPHQLRQVCALAMGAHLPEAECQVARNEGTSSSKQPLASTLTA
jgi:hypothetical protein